MKTLLSLALFVLLSPIASLAQGDHSGGGGDILICTTPVVQKGLFKQIFGKKRKTNYYLLDVYEAESVYKLRLNLGGPNLTMQEKIELVRKDFALVDPYRANRYAAEALQIASDLEAIELGMPAMQPIATLLDQRLVNIPDADDQYSFNWCKSEQLVRQEKPTDLGVGSAFYQFDRKYWQKLDIDNKVATLFHEVIYREFREYAAARIKALQEKGLYDPTKPFSNSGPSRQLNAYLFSRSASQLPLPKYLGFLAQNGAKEYFFNSNVGKVRLYNHYADRWSAIVTPDGLITDVLAQYARIELATFDSRLAKLPLKSVTTYSFNRARDLVAMNGKFSISYDPARKKIHEFNADCQNSAYPCVTGNSIAFEANGRLRLIDQAESMAFDLDGNLYR